MEFRRIPFQFTSTDPAKRQAELQKRFGLPAKQEKMYIDLANPGLMNMKKKEPNSASSSPRLQHRVPIFVDGMSEADKSVDANPTNVDAGQKSRVRIVPIEIEDPDGSKRHRSLSGSSCVNGNSYNQGSGISDAAKPRRSWLPDDVNSKVESMSFKSPSGPKVCTIPVKIEGADENSKSKASSGKTEQTPKAKFVQKNGCNVTKVNNCEKNNVPISPACEVSLKKINIVLEKLIDYQSDVEKFSGTVKEKQYRYLDEMLTRLMLDLDNVETMGNENVRLSRKAAIKKVQHCIDLLESKVSDSSSNQTVSNAELPSQTVKDSDIVEMDPVAESSRVVAGGSNVVESQVPEVEMEDSTTNAQGSKRVDLTEMHQSQQVHSMETEDAQTISDKMDELLSEICENENLTESNADEIKVPSTGLEQESEFMAPMEVAKSGNADGLQDLNTRESEVPEVEMKNLVTNTQTLEMQTESCHQNSVGTDAAVGNGESMSELGKDCSIHIETCETCNEPSSLTESNAIELSSDLTVQNKCSMNKVFEMESSDVSIAPSIPGVKTDSHMESMPSEHSHVPSVETAVTSQ